MAGAFGPQTAVAAVGAGVGAGAGAGAGAGNDGDEYAWSAVDVSEHTAKAGVLAWLALLTESVAVAVEIADRRMRKPSNARKVGG